MRHAAPPSPRKQTIRVCLGRPRKSRFSFSGISYGTQPSFWKTWRKTLCPDFGVQRTLEVGDNTLFSDGKLKNIQSVSQFCMRHWLPEQTKMGTDLHRFVGRMGYRTNGSSACWKCNMVYVALTWILCALVKGYSATNVPLPRGAYNCMYM